MINYPWLILITAVLNSCNGSRIIGALPKISALLKRLKNKPVQDIKSRVTRPVSIFRYDVPDRILMGSDYKDFESCPRSFYSAEIVIPAITSYRLHQPDYDSVSEDPESYSYDYYLVPQYSSCHFHQCLSRPGAKWWACRHETDQYLKRILDWVETHYPFWHRNQGLDHIFIFTWDEASNLFSDSFLRNRLASSIHLTHIGTTTAVKNFVPGKDICIPALREYKEVDDVPQRFETDLEGPGKKRPIFAYFRGTFWDDRKVYGREVRNTIKRLGETNPNLFYIKDKHSQFYWNELLRVRFALCPPGWASWSPRLFDAIVAGAIPVIISDDWVPPFADTIDYDQFSIRVPEHKADKLHEILQSIPVQVEAALRKNLEKVYEHFVYSMNFYGTKDAFETIYDTLIKRKAEKEERLKALLEGYNEADRETDYEDEQEEHSAASDYDDSVNNIVRSVRVEL